MSQSRVSDNTALVQAINDAIKKYSEELTDQLVKEAVTEFDAKLRERIGSVAIRLAEYWWRQSDEERRHP